MTALWGYVADAFHTILFSQYYIIFTSFVQYWHEIYGMKWYMKYKNTIIIYLPWLWICSMMIFSVFVFLRVVLMARSYILVLLWRTNSTYVKWLRHRTTLIVESKCIERRKNGTELSLCICSLIFMYLYSSQTEINFLRGQFLYIKGTMKIKETIHFYFVYIYCSL